MSRRAVVAPKQAPFRPRPVERTTQRHTKAHSLRPIPVSQARRAGGRAAVGSGSGRQSRRGPEGSAAAEMGSRDGTPAQAGDFGAGEVLGALCDLVEVDLCAVQHTACNMQRAACNTRRATCTAPHATCNMQSHSYDAQHAPHRTAQHATHDARRATCNRTCGAKRSPHRRAQPL